MNLILNILIFSKIEIGEVSQKAQDKFIPEPDLKVEIWIENLEITWSLIFLEEERALVSERPGRIRLIEKGILKDKPIKIIKDVYHSGEGGLMGLLKSGKIIFGSSISLIVKYISLPR